MRNKNWLVDFHKIVFSTFLNYFQEAVSFHFTYLYCKNTYSDVGLFQVFQNYEY